MKRVEEEGLWVSNPRSLCVERTRLRTKLGRDDPSGDGGDQIITAGKSCRVEEGVTDGRGILSLKFR